MEQRPLRLGDILDDYCPRERRVTNHAVVAMIEDTVKQTRCTTCDADHPYKGGHAPRRRKKGAPAEAALVETETPLPATQASPASHASPAAAETPDDNVTDSDESFDDAPVLVTAPAPAADEPAPLQAAADEPDDEAQPDSAPLSDDDSDQPMADGEEGPVHRRLIRATLPRIEGQKDERRPTDFTIRQGGGRDGNVARPSFRGGNNPRTKSRGGAGAGGGFSNGNGHRPGGAPRFGGARPGQGQGRGQGGGFRSAQQQPRQGGGGRKRSR